MCYDRISNISSLHFLVSFIFYRIIGDISGFNHHHRIWSPHMTQVIHIPKIKPRLGKNPILLQSIMHVYISATLSVRQEIKKGRSSVKYYIFCLFIFIKYIYINFLSRWYDVWIYIYLHFYEKNKNYW